MTRVILRALIDAALALIAVNVWSLCVQAARYVASTRAHRPYVVDPSLIDRLLREMYP
jgi:hypothetical protein